MIVNSAYVTKPTILGMELGVDDCRETQLEQAAASQDTTAGRFRRLHTKQLGSLNLEQTVQFPPYIFSRIFGLTF